MYTFNTMGNFLKLHEALINKGDGKHIYLCNEITEGRNYLNITWPTVELMIFDLIKPDLDDKMELLASGDPTYVWGNYGTNGEKSEYNSFRQTIVLLCAAVNDEL